MTIDINITQQLSKNTIDFLILQTIAECKLNRRETPILGSTSIFEQFYNYYLLNNKSFYNSNGTLNSQLVDQLKVAVGSFANLNSAAENKNTEGSPFEGGAGSYTKLTSTQVDYFVKNYNILDYHGNDNTGFSATLFKNNTSGEKTISFRSTEYAEDFYKDTTADREIDANGTAIAQITSLVNYIENLKRTGILQPGDKLNVTGYSLGGHLASTFYKMYANEFDFGTLDFFNSPGVGYIQPLTNNEDPYVSFKDTLKQYNLLVTNLQSLKQYFSNTPNKPITFDNCLEFFTSNPLLPIYSSLANYLATLALSNKLENIISNIDNDAFVGTNIENELDKVSLITQNKDPSYLNNTLYSNDFYKNYKAYLKSIYNPSKVLGFGGLEIQISGVAALTAILAANTKMIPYLTLQNKFGYQVNNDFFGGKATWISGLASVNYGDATNTDYNLVSNSNYYSNPLDLIIEDRVEWEGDGGRLPISEFTKNNTGDFGNTHSITLLNKSLSLMTFLANIENQSLINVSKYTGIVSASTSEKANHTLTEDDKKEILINSYSKMTYGEANGISQVVNTLYRAIIPKTQQQNDIIFDSNTAGGWADINIINTLQERQNLIQQQLANTNTIIQLESFYTAQNIDFVKTNNGPLFIYKSNDDIYNLAMQDNEIGKAYRYAIENLNTFVIKGLDYNNIAFSSKNISAHSTEWYKTRIEVLMGVVKSNVQNNSDYLSIGNIAVNDISNSIKFHTIKEKYASGYQTMEDVERAYNEPRSTINYSFEPPKNLSYTQYYSSQFHYTGRLVDLKFDAIYNLLRFTTLPTNDKKDSDLAKSLNIKDNIYYLDHYASSFTSLRKNDNEKIFISPDKSAIYAIKDESYSIYKYQSRFTGTYVNNIDDVTLVSNIQLLGGDDYLEVAGDVVNIFTTKGKKTYNITAKTTTINDLERKGTITLDGILLDGGLGFGIDDRFQVLSIAGIEHVISYKLDSRTQRLIITHNNTGHVIYVNNMIQYGNSFGFPNQLTEQKLISHIPNSEYTNINQNIIEKEIILKSSYNNVQDFQKDLKIETGFNSNALNYTIGNDLFIYNPSNPSIIIKVKNYLFSYSSQIIDSNGQSQNISGIPMIARDIQNPNQYIAIRPKNNYNIQSYLNTALTGNVYIDYLPNDRYSFTQSIFNHVQINKSGNDLLFSDSSNVNKGYVYIRNYFKFDHTDHSNIYVQQAMNGNVSRTTRENPIKFTSSELTVNETASFFSYISGDGNDLIIADDSTLAKKFNGGLGDDTIIGNSSDELFQSTGVNMTSGYFTYMDGDDTFTGNGGADKFIFQEHFGSDIITDFSNNDTIYISSQHLYLDSNNVIQGYTLERENNDLIINIQEGGTSPVEKIYSGSLHVNGYFNSIDYKTNSRLVFMLGGTTDIASLPYSIVYNENYEGFLPSDDIVAPLDIISFDKKTIENISKHTLHNDDITYIQPLDINAPTTITANMQDNNITITNNNTTVINNDHSGEYNSFNNTDGDDNYTINILDNNPIIKQHFRTEINFDLHGGTDSVIHGEFKKDNEYGDIIKINTNKNNIVFQTSYNDLRVITKVTAILSDGSAINIELQEGIDTNAAIIQSNDSLITLNDIVTLSKSINIIDNPLANTIDVHNEYKSYNIMGNGGNDTIKSGHGNDYIIAGTGNDIIYLSDGYDVYKFKKGDGVDTYYLPSYTVDYNGIILIDPLFNLADIKYSYNDLTKEIYLNFSPTEGLIFKNADWVDLHNIIEKLPLRFDNGAHILPNYEISNVTATTFIPIPVVTDIVSNGIRLVTGTPTANTINADSVNNNIILGNDGNDLIAGREGAKRSLIFGGKGDDTIFSAYQDIITVREGDGHDTITFNAPYMTLNIEHNVTRMNGNKEILFDLSSQNGRDLMLTYDNAGDSMLLKNFFAQDGTIQGNVGVSTYNKDTDQMSLYYINNILSSLGITASSLINSTSSLQVFNTDATSHYTSPKGAGYILGGEIAYQYLNTGSYSLNSQAQYIMTQINNNNLILNKH